MLGFLRVSVTSRQFIVAKALSTTASFKMHADSIDNPGEFWKRAAKDINWIRACDKTLELSPLNYGLWFHGGALNMCYNCVDRHIHSGNGSKNAMIYESPVTETTRKLSFNELHESVVKLSSVLRTYGIAKGDRVVIYMPNIPEASIAMLACARIGAIHSVVFGGFAAAELATRIRDCKPKMIIAASCGIDGKKTIDYKTLVNHAVDLAGKEGHSVKHCLIFQRPQYIATLLPHRDLDWNIELNNKRLKISEHYEVMKASDPLYILYTSGTTGSPKGVLRDTGGYAVALHWAMKHFYGMSTKDTFWAASDVGWVVGHSFSVYGPLLLGCTSVLYEGKPVGTPDAANFWRVIEKHQVNALFTAPTAIRAIKRIDEEGALPAQFDLKSLRTVFLAGERADPDTLKWVEHAVKVPVRDHWWQTETGWPICGNLVGVDGYQPIKYGSTFTPCPGYDVQILDEHHKQVKPNTLGSIAIKLPLPPGALLTLYNSEERFASSYLKAIPGYYDTGDAGYVDEDGYVFVMSRTDDVINVAGHRLSSGAMEEVIADHDDVAEVAVVGVKDSYKGQIPLGLLVLNLHSTKNHQTIIDECIAMVRARIGPVASFKDAVVVERLPKTRSGKILRATMRAIANGEPFKIPPTIEDPAAVDEVTTIIRQVEAKMHPKKKH